MQTFKAISISEYLQILEKIGINKYIYRGQNEPYWGINANGFRTYQGGWYTDKIFNINTISKAYYNQIISKLATEEKQYFLAFCQHHGIPTNLIDFSYSPLIALFFACQGKQSPRFSVQELVGDISVDELKKDTPMQQMLVHNLINSLEKETISEFAQVYLIEKCRLIDITEILAEMQATDFTKGLYSNGQVRIILMEKLSVLFAELTDDEISAYLVELIQCYKDNNADIYGYDIDNKNDEASDLIMYQVKLQESPLKDVISDFYWYVFNTMEDERIPYESNFVDSYPEGYNTQQVAATIYILLLANLIQIFDNDMNGTEKLDLNLHIYFTYQPANMFDRINVQRGLFVFQPYIYAREQVYDFNVLSTQNINPQICIEIDNCSEILDNLDTMGINLGTVYGDLDNIAKAVVTSYKRKNQL